MQGIKVSKQSITKDWNSGPCCPSKMKKKLFPVTINGCFKCAAKFWWMDIIFINIYPN